MQPSLVVSTVSIPAAEAEGLIAHLPAGSVSWVRRGEGLVGSGAVAVLRTSGPTRFAEAAKWWAELVARAQITDEIGEPGTGLVSFGSFAFADHDTDVDSVLVVPQVIVGRRGQVAWRTTVVDADADADACAGRETPLDATVPSGSAPKIPTAPARPSLHPTFVEGPGSLSEEAWTEVVAEATRRINAGELEKVVLARDVTARADAPVDVRGPLAFLAEHYPMCWTFHVEGLFGATPELLVRRERGLVTSRVLAGTIRRTGDDARDNQLAGRLARSSKDLEEHEYAVRSVADALEPHCSSMNVPEAPYVLHLPNVMHLATDVTGVVRDGISSLELAAALHPSAAVGGTPREAAVALIAEIEGMGRDRYAAPVGWMDASGDGEWGIALRSGLIEGEQVRLFAGCGVVGSSDPACELAESNAKLVPVRAALGL